MARKRKRIRLISIFKRISVVDEPQQAPLHNEIIITESDTISLTSMVLTAKRQGDFYVAEVATVEADGYITGTITAANSVVKGRVKGTITCTDELLVKSTAIIEGTAIAKKMTIEAGAIINGALHITEDVQTQPLLDKLAKATLLLNNGHMPEVEEIDAVEPMAPPRVEPMEIPAEPPARVQAVKKKLKTKRVDNTPPPTDEKMGGWW